ncbi:response regulator [Wolinella succinogenes]|uniref:response regulator n=1 Tax=Wolinella succinogenes TaxID=844 RepID=UPI00240965D2|nr:response regulator [Wolinella succinogenes]
MRVLIVENEIYLAQSIAAKLSDFGFECEIVSLMNEALREQEYDVVLLSTNVSGQNYYPIIEKHKDSIIILMISYVSDDTVSKPLKAGAKDYILKPFMIDELIRKIEHYRTFQKLKKEVQFYRRYLDFALSDFPSSLNQKLTTPFVIKSSTQKSADAYAIAYAKHKDIPLDFLSIKEGFHWRDKLKRALPCREIKYIVGLEELKKSERKELLEIVAKSCVILSFVSSEEIEFPSVVDISSGVKNLDLGGEILSLDDYIKNIIVRYENKYPDTELSRRLGMSRKSLWEKRKKYGISKKK